MKQFKQIFLSFALANLMLVSIGALAQTAFAPGAVLGGASIVNGDTLAGDTLVASTGPVSFNAGVFSGVANTSVFADNDNTGGFGAGKLEFVYELSNSGPDKIDQWTLGLFTNVQAKVAYSSAFPSGTLPFTVTRAAGTGYKIDVDFLGGSVNSLLGYTHLIVYTDSDSYYPGEAFVQNFGNTNYRIFAPVPEPEIYAMMAAGLGLMGWVARRRKVQVVA